MKSKPHIIKRNFDTASENRQNDVIGRLRADFRTNTGHNTRLFLDLFDLVKQLTVKVDKLEKEVRELNIG